MIKTLTIVLVTLISFGFQTKKAKVDFSSPQSTVETFIEAATKKDKKVLSQCFSDQSPGEWNSIRDQSISKKNLEELNMFVTDAQITKVEMKGEDAALVFVSFKIRDEKIHMIKKGDRWFILDF